MSTVNLLKKNIIKLQRRVQHNPQKKIRRIVLQRVQYQNWQKTRNCSNQKIQQKNHHETHRKVQDKNHKDNVDRWIKNKYIQKKTKKKKGMSKRQFILLKKIELIDSMDDQTFRKFQSMPKNRQDMFVYKILFADGYYKYRPEEGIDQIQRTRRISLEEVSAADSPLYRKALSRIGRNSVLESAKIPALTVAATKAMAKESASEQLQVAEEYVKRRIAVEGSKAAGSVGKYIVTHIPVLDKFFLAINRGIVKLSAAITALFTPLLIPAASILFCIFYFLMVVGSSYYYQYSQLGNAALSEEVLAYYDTVSFYAEKYDISEFVPLLLAMMMQESRGLGTDPMQCSESPFNVRYPNTVGAIQDPEYSIDVGCQTLVYSLNNAECTDPSDIEGIKLALQDYNFGNGYAKWALRIYGGYTLENANEFSSMQAALHGWSSYGDVEYPAHVLRYYSIGNGLNLGMGVIGANGWCWPVGATAITDTFGYQAWRGGVHNGLDVGASTGTPIYAASGGTVWIAGYSSSAGNWIVIEHGGGVKTVYMHASELYVSSGQSVYAGQVIAAVGSTGNSTGPHLHFGIMVNSSYNGYDGSWVDPLLYVSPN